MGLGRIVLVVLSIAVAALPALISLLALLDAASRPEWAFALAGRSRTLWVAMTAFGFLLCVLGIVIAGYYLFRVRPEVAAAENGRLDV